MLPVLKQNERKRVAAYVRVSTKEKLQLDSLNNQIEHYKNLFKDNQNYELVDIFIDEGISGTSIKGRNGLKNLIELIEKKEIDLVITKSISRFARNTTDLLKLIREFKAANVEIYFEKEGFSSFSKENELMISILAAFAQIESENISTNIKWSILKEREKGKSFNQFKVLGYRWINNKLVINDEEAEIIKIIYKKYEEGQSGKRIAEYLNSLDDFHFDSSSIYYILRNPIYAGDLFLGKYYTVSPINKKIKRNKNENTINVILNDHPAIIEKLHWQKIQLLIKERTDKKCR